MAIIALIAVVAVAVILLEATDGGSILGVGNLAASDIAGYAQNAGFEGDDLTTAVAIALAESSGNPGAVGDTAITPGGSIGLWQINLQAHPQYTAAQLTDPQTNANAAYAIYQAAGNSFTPWSTFNSPSGSPAYLSYLATAEAATGDTTYSG